MTTRAWPGAAGASSRAVAARAAIAHATVAHATATHAAATHAATHAAAAHAAAAHAAATSAMMPARRGRGRRRGGRASATRLGVEHIEARGQITVDRLQLAELIIAQPELARVVDQVADRRARGRWQRWMLGRLYHRLGVVTATEHHGERKTERGAHVTSPRPGPSPVHHRAGFCT